MITVAPSTSYEATLELGTTGLVGTLELGTYDGDTATQALASSSINEISASGVYVATRTSPGTSGQYVLIWSLDGTLDPDQVITEDLLVTSDEAAAVGGTSNLYASSADLKAWLNITSSGQDDEIAIAVSAASRAIDGYKQTRYYSTSETRYYSPSFVDIEVQIDDLVTLTSVKNDLTGDGSYGDTWTENTDFVLTPLNNALEDKPKRSLRIARQSTKSFSGYDRGLQVVGTFGWAAVPIMVKQAALLLGARFYTRRNSPVGILSVGTENAVAAYLTKVDPDFAFLMDQVEGGHVPRMIA